MATIEIGPDAVRRAIRLATLAICGEAERAGDVLTPGETTVSSYADLLLAVGAVVAEITSDVTRAAGEVPVDLDGLAADLVRLTECLAPPLRDFIGMAEEALGVNGRTVLNRVALRFEAGQ